MLGILPLMALAHGWQTSFLFYSSDYVLPQARTAIGAQTQIAPFALSEPQQLDPKLNHDPHVHRGVLKELQMNFTISGEDFTFTLSVDPNGTLTSFTAEKDSTNYDCSIQVSASGALMPEVFCCTPQGCTSGSCSAG